MDLNEETRNGFTISSKMKEIWSMELQMTKLVLDVCKKYDLRIWVEGGTLLGTVRHHGFIPWDDDIDLIMPRDDYEKLLTVADKEFKSPYFFQCAYTDTEYYRGHAQLRLDNTAAILSKDSFNTFHQGIFIDIFCFDSVPDIIDEKWNKKLRRADEIQHILGYCSYRLSVFSNPKNIFYRLLYLYYKISNKTIELFKEYENLFKGSEYKDSKYVGYPTFLRTNSERTTRKKEWFSETIYLPFEDIVVPVPIGYAEILRKQYGENYMTPIRIPPLHGGEILFDTKKSYKEYLPDLRKKKKEEFKQNRIEKIKKLLKF